MIKRSIALALSLLVTSTLLTGCGDKDPLTKLSKGELIDLANEQAGLIEENTNRVTELENLLQGVQEEEVPTASISIMEDGTDRMTFNSFDGKITFPTPFEYPGSTQAPNTSSINITSTLNINPTNNWAIKLNGTTLKLEHNSGISGSIKAGYIEEIYDRQALQDEVMSSFFAAFPPSTITYSKLFLADGWWGCDAQAPTRIDGEDAYIRAGMLGLGEQSFVYVFVYKSKQDATKDEAILSLLRTISMGGQQLSIE